MFNIDRKFDQLGGVATPLPHGATNENTAPNESVPFQLAISVAPQSVRQDTQFFQERNCEKDTFIAANARLGANPWPRTNPLGEVQTTGDEWLLGMLRADPSRFLAITTMCFGSNAQLSNNDVAMLPRSLERLDDTWVVDAEAISCSAFSGLQQLETIHAAVECPKHLQAILALPKLQRLRLEIFGPVEGMLRQFASMRENISLDELTIEQRITPEIGSLLSSLKSLKALTALECSEEQLIRLLSNSCVEHITVRMSERILGEKEFQQILRRDERREELKLELKKNPGLELGGRLNSLEILEWRDSSLMPIVLKKLMNLRHLHIASSSLDRGDEAPNRHLERIVQELPLYSLNLENLTVTWHMLHNIRHSRIESLSLQKCKIKKHELNRFLEKIPCLIALDLRGIYISELALQSISEHGRLAFLAMSIDQPFTFKHFKLLEQMKGLRHIYLCRDERDESEPGPICNLYGLKELLEKNSALIVHLDAVAGSNESPGLFRLSHTNNPDSDVEFTEYSGTNGQVTLTALQSMYPKRLVMGETPGWICRQLS